MRRIIGVGIALLVVVGAIVGIMSSGRSAVGEKSGGGSSAASAADAAPAYATGRAAPGEVAANANGAGGTTTAIGAPAPSGPALPTVPTRVIKHARVDLRIRGRVLDARVQAARDAATAVGGYVEQTEQSATGASMTIRVPAARYAEVLDGIEHLGRVTNRSERGDDVTANVTDLEARIRNLRAQEAVLAGPHAPGPHDPRHDHGPTAALGRDRADRAAHRPAAGARRPVELRDIAVGFRAGARRPRRTTTGRRSVGPSPTHSTSWSRWPEASSSCSARWCRSPSSPGSDWWCGARSGGGARSSVRPTPDSARPPATRPGSVPWRRDVRGQLLRRGPAGARRRARCRAVRRPRPRPAAAPA